MDRIRKLRRSHPRRKRARGKIFDQPPPLPYALNFAAPLKLPAMMYLTSPLTDAVNRDPATSDFPHRSVNSSLNPRLFPTSLPLRLSPLSLNLTSRGELTFRDDPSVLGSLRIASSKLPFTMDPSKVRFATCAAARTDP